MTNCILEAINSSIQAYISALTGGLWPFTSHDWLSARRSVLTCCLSSADLMKARRQQRPIPKGFYATARRPVCDYLVRLCDMSTIDKSNWWSSKKWEALSKKCKALSKKCDTLKRSRCAISGHCPWTRPSPRASWHKPPVRLPQPGRAGESLRDPCLCPLKAKAYQVRNRDPVTQILRKAVQLSPEGTHIEGRRASTLADPPLRQGGAVCTGPSRRKKRKNNSAPRHSALINA